MKNFQQQRIKKLLGLFSEEEFDLIAINAGQSLIYFSDLHFHLSERPAVLLIDKTGKVAFIFPEFEKSKIEKSPIEIEPFGYSENKITWGPAFRDAISFFGLKNPIIGIEPTCMRFLEMDLLKFENESIKFSSAAHLFETIRAKKDEAEIDYMRKAISIAETALNQTLPLIKAGATESFIANELVINLLKNGSDPELPFAPIVAGGPNSANPHAVPGERELQNGDLLIIDWGAKANGYISDITRTFAIGNIDEQLSEIFETVKAANASARSANNQELFGNVIDEKARSVIRNAGYGDQFTHRTGHGIGMEPHEAPYISSENDKKLLAGNTFTIEPGIYLLGKGGVRIEDDMYVVEDGLETLTTLKRELITL